MPEGKITAAAIAGRNSGWYYPAMRNSIKWPWSPPLERLSNERFETRTKAVARAKELIAERFGNEYLTSS